MEDLIHINASMVKNMEILGLSTDSVNNNILGVFGIK